MRKKFLLTAILLLLVVTVTALFSCVKKPEETDETALVTAEKKTEILFLGDSIGEALAGPRPLTERENYGYYGIVGTINDFSFHNRAVTAYTTEDLMNFVEREDDGINLVRTYISTADVIHISNIGNDFLNSSHNQLMIDLSNDVYDRITPRQETAKANFENTFATLKRLNPNALLFVQTLYNPAGEDSPLVPSYARNVLASKGIGPKDYHAVMDKLIRVINQTLLDYQQEHSYVDDDGNTVKPFEIIDVYAAFENIYEDDHDRWQRLFCEDGVHPSGEGHAILAELLQDKLASHGLAAPNALYQYKKQKVSQLNRLYGELENKEEVRKAIMRAVSFGEVTKAYFDGVKYALPHVEMGVRTGRTFDMTKRFDVSYFAVFGDEYTGAIDKKQASITFEKDGTYKLTLPLLELVTALLKGIVQESGFNLNSEFAFGLASDYFSDIVPGVEKTDLAAVLKGVEQYYGIRIIGLDYENPHLQAIFTRYAQTGQLIIDDPDAFDDVIGIECVGTYSLESVTAGGKTYTAIYVNNAVGKGESYIRYTYTKGEEGEKVRMTIDVIGIELEGVILSPDEE